MAQRYDAVIIGGGHNGLVSAAYLARAGWKTLVLEQRHVRTRLKELPPRLRAMGDVPGDELHDCVMITV